MTDLTDLIAELLTREQALNALAEAARDPSIERLRLENRAAGLRIALELAEERRDAWE